MREEITPYRLIPLRSNLNSILVNLLLAAFLIAVFSNVNITLAEPFVDYTGQYTNYTNHKYQIQFQYPSNWRITQLNDTSNANIRISDSSSSTGPAIIEIWFRPLSDYSDLVTSAWFNDGVKDVSDSIVRKVTEHLSPLRMTRIINTT